MNSNVENRKLLLNDSSMLTKKTTSDGRQPLLSLGWVAERVVRSGL